MDSKQWPSVRLGDLARIKHGANIVKLIKEGKMPEKVIWVLGAEDKGMRITTERACDELVSLPQVSADASYNVSVAAGMALAETKRQWK